MPSFDQIAAAIAALAATYDTAGIYPSEDIHALRDAGLLQMFSRSVEPDVIVLMNALREIGRANLNVGRIYEGHVNGAKLVAWHGSAPQRARLTSDVKAGHVLAVWATEAPPCKSAGEAGDDTLRLVQGWDGNCNLSGDHELCARRKLALKFVSGNLFPAGDIQAPPAGVARIATYVRVHTDNDTTLYLNHQIVSADR